MSATALSLAGCGDDGDTSGNGTDTTAAGAAGSPTAQQPKQGGTLALGIRNEPDTLDPAGSTGGPMVTTYVAEWLVRVDPQRKAGEQRKLIGGLAESWAYNADGTQLTDKLRPSVQFHDGEPFNAEAVKFNFERCTNPNHPGFKPQFKSVTSGSYQFVQQVDVVDQLPVRYEFNAPFFDWLEKTLTPATYVLLISPKSVRENGPDVAARNPIGTGPFRFKEWIRGERVTLEQNPAYWGGAPLLDQMVLRAFPDATARQAALEAREIDYNAVVGVDQIKQVRGNNGLKLLLPDVGHPNFWIIYNKDRVTANKQFRQAMNFAVDTDKISKEFYQDTFARGVQWFDPASYAFEPGFDQYKYDPQRAKALVSQSGYDGRELTLLMSDAQVGADSNEVLQSQLGAAGIKVRLAKLDFAEYAQQIAKGTSTQYPLAQTRWPSLTPSSLEEFFHSSFQPPNGFNRSWYAGGAEVDKLLVDARTNPDQQQRAKLYREAQRRIMDDAPHIFNYYSKDVSAVSLCVQGLANDLGFDSFWQRLWVESWAPPVVIEGTERHARWISA